MDRAIIRQTRIEQKYRGLLECAPDATVIADAQGTIVLVNTEAERMFGYARGELLGENVELLVPEGLHDRRWCTSSNQSGPLRLRRKRDFLPLCRVVRRPLILSPSCS